MRKNLLGSLLAVGFMALGCGGADLDPAGLEPRLATREDQVPACTGERYRTLYYSDAAQSSIVGYEGCECFQWVRFGVRSSFSEYVEYESCY
ncbi:hypothetical protein [Corallococcus sp. 4LFB]|uniref:hypothetical protein n=1 Tax=Corallococcus sp. 4LFB TaxID=3383249 RepID=UPI003977058F